MSTTTGALGVMGGTFDPVHNGHLRAALEVTAGCGLASMRLVLSGQPPHRPAPLAPASLRLQMLRAAVTSEPRMVVDDREVRRGGPSYTVDTLKALREEVGERPLCLVVGADAFIGLPGWHRWQEIFRLAHLVVVHRPGWKAEPAGELALEWARRRSDDVRDLSRSPAGTMRVQPITALGISSSAIRELVASGGDPRFLVPDAVRDIMLSSGCYQRQSGVKAGSMEV